MPFVIASSPVWFPEQPKNVAKRTGAEVILVEEKNQLTPEYLKALKGGVKQIFVPHWSHIISPEIYEHFECIIFHMTDLPFGRGGTPLQNLIARGIYKTQITAFRCVKELDAGPVYMKRPFSLHGPAREIYVRFNKSVEDMIVSIIQDPPEPQEQEGDVVIFKRRTEKDGGIAQLKSLEQAYDYIRMLDADGYPKAFIESENFRIEFSQASLQAESVTANIEIKLKKENGTSK
jgi:methionyl-tRNA formyltransferase